MQRAWNPIEGVWLKILIFILFSYAVFGKGFAYTFLGEATLVLGFLTYLLSRRVMLIFSDPVLLLWAAFAGWGVCRTLPFLSKYRFDAVRDAVLWGYGLFALIIVAFVNNSSQISRALNAYRRFLRWYLPLVPFLLLVSIWLPGLVPVLPWTSGIRAIWLKGGDAAVHLSAAGLFLLIFRARWQVAEKQRLSIFGSVRFVGWALAAIAVMIDTRAGFMAVVIPILVAAIVKLRSIGSRVGIYAVVTILLGITILGSNVITIRTQGRTFNADQVIANLESIVSSKVSSGSNIESTKGWRLIWWRHIIQYTLFGPYRWTGKGFGVNLAVEDGPPGMTAEESKLRSPHNGNLTVLARMGVPGMTLWVAMNLTFVFSLARAYRRAVRMGAQFWTNLNLWILCYWLAALINMSFDVYLEGPQGGIWFWSIIGFGVAALRIQAYEARQSLARREITRQAAD
jgi:hypothetical protein